jgi:KipI family sensor histidine kinase inhibitor
MTVPTIVPAGDSAVVVEFENRIDEAVNARVLALAAAVRAEPVAGVRDVVPTFRSVTIYFDPLRVDLDALTLRLERVARSHTTEPLTAGREVRVPVRYGGESGPDLESVARYAGLSTDDVVEIHSGRTYRVFMLGFVPGFPYMASVDARIAAPRLATPRVRVRAGSVGIAGAQTGIYPADTPGGWQIIGRTSVALFDLSRAEPCVFRPGDAVRFDPISPA